MNTVAVHAELACGPGDGLPVVARARREHAGGALRLVERRQLVDRAAHLERAGPLQVLGLQADGAPDPPRERVARVHRRHPRVARDAVAGRFDVSESRTVQFGTPARGSHEPPSTGRAGAPARRRAGAAAPGRRGRRARGAGAHARTRPGRPRSRGSRGGGVRARRRPRARPGARRSSPRASSTPSPRTASVRTIGGFQPSCGPSASTCRTSFSIVFAIGWSILLIAITSGISMIPAFSAWIESPEPGISASTTVSAIESTPTSL